VFQTYITDAAELEEYENSALDLGWEGTMLRSLNGKYKFGRSSVKEGYLLKRKLFTDGEFEIIGYTEKMHNANEAFVNELGRTDRSTNQANLIPMDTLGALICETNDGKVFNVGTGYDDFTRKFLWNMGDRLIGRLAKVKYFEKGMVDVPLLPVYIDLRDPLDM
jgi:DNA ligase-1